MKKTMKKIAAATLAAVMVTGMSVSAFAEAAPEEVVEEAAADGQVYTNEFFGFDFTAPEGFTLDDNTNLTEMNGFDASKDFYEQVNTALEAGNLVYIMLCTADQEADGFTDNININVIKAAEGYSDETLAGEMDDAYQGIVSAYEQMGATVTGGFEPGTFVGKDTQVVNLDAELAGIKFTMRQFYLIQDGYLAVITLSAGTQDRLDVLEAGFAAL